MTRQCRKQWDLGAQKRSEHRTGDWSEDAPLFFLSSEYIAGDQLVNFDRKFAANGGYDPDFARYGHFDTSLYHSFFSFARRDGLLYVLDSDVVPRLRSEHKRYPSILALSAKTVAPVRPEFLRFQADPDTEVLVERLMYGTTPKMLVHYVDHRRDRVTRTLAGIKEERYPQDVPPQQIQFYDATPEAAELTTLVKPALDALIAAYKPQ